MAPDSYIALKHRMEYVPKAKNSRTCERCEHSVTVKYRGGTDRMNCRALGVADEDAATIKPGAGCAAWKVRWTK